MTHGCSREVTPIAIEELRATGGLSTPAGLHGSEAGGQTRQRARTKSNPCRTYLLDSSEGAQRWSSDTLRRSPSACHALLRQACFSSETSSTAIPVTRDALPGNLGHRNRHVSVASMQRADAAKVAEHECDWRRAHEALSRLARQRAQADAEEGRWLLVARRSAAHVHLGFGSFGEYIERLLGYTGRSLQVRPGQDGAAARGARGGQARGRRTRRGEPARDDAPRAALRGGAGDVRALP